MISVIVPIYNVENYLRPCVDSILNSTYRDIELILVDDGSTDASPSICDQYAGIDSRVRVIHKVNQGVSEARNTGLDAAEGSFIMFVDGDDVIHPNMIQVLYQAINDGDYDFSMVKGKKAHVSQFESELNDESIGLSAAHKQLSQRDLMTYIMGPSWVDFQYIVVWNKLFRRNLVKGLEFKNTGSEDAEWSTRMCLLMNNAVIVDAEMYYWVQREGSFTHMGMRPVAIDRINSYLICLNDIPKENKFYRALSLEKLYKVILHTRYNADGTKYVDDVKSLATRVYRQTVNEYLMSRMNWKNKWGLLFLFYFPSIHRRFMKRKQSK